MWCYNAGEGTTGIASPHRTISSPHYAMPRPAFSRFPSRRSVVHSANGIVACSQPLAAQAGLKILRDGGNAAVSPASSPHKGLR